MSPHKFFYGLFSVTQSLFLLGFSRRTDNITARNKKSTYGPEKALYLYTFHAVWVVYTTCLSKSLIASQVVIFQHVFWGLLQGVLACVFFLFKFLSLANPGGQHFYSASRLRKSFPQLCNNVTCTNITSITNVSLLHAAVIVRMAINLVHLYNKIVVKPA